MSKKMESGTQRQPESGGGSPGRVLAAAGDEQTSPQQEQPSGAGWTPEMEKRLGEQIAAEVEKRFQSAKDKRWTQLERQFGALSEFQQTLQSAQEDKPIRSSDRKPGGDWMAQKTADLLEAAGLANDPEVKQLFQSEAYAPNPEGYLELLGDLTELVLRRSGRRAASAASVTQPGGGTPAPNLRSEYETRKRRLRPGDINALMELKREFRQKGLDIF
ncbi:MAG: hypothetical protein OEZ02_10440 [Anaerolineae bacterium]|nr:hypothetical protein [Anaerolineae bacterium]